MVDILNLCDDVAITQTHRTQLTALFATMDGSTLRQRLINFYGTTDSSQMLDGEYQFTQMYM
jgi:hypothetical protein